jgi:type III pantothenate kinase
MSDFKGKGMLLVIDVGNTQTVFGVYDAAQLKAHFRLSSDRERTADEFAALFANLLAVKGFDRSQFSHAALASVVPPLTDVLRRMCTESLGVTPLVVGPGIKTGIAILYDNPREVGADRIVNALAGFERFRHEPEGPHGVIIVDFGTATTFDVVSPRGEYLGGAIAPGIAISADALFQRASKLPRVDLSVPTAAVGKNTVQSMQSGILFGYAALVDGMIGRLSAELDYAPRVIATGGLAGTIAGLCTRIEAVEEFLTLDGLRLLHERNL